MKKGLLIVLMISAAITAQAQVSVVFKIGKLPKDNTDDNFYLAGNFNNWNPADSKWKMITAVGGYQIYGNVPAGNISFKVTRGSWEKVECDSTGRSISNREYIITRDTTIVLDIAGWQDMAPKLPVKHTASSNVHIMAEKFDIPQLNTQRRIWVYLPDGYETSGKKYPVLYMHDGQNLFDEATGNFGEWGIDETMDKLPAAKQCIIIGIDNGGMERIAEYSPFPSKYAAEAKGDAYLDFIVNTLKPYVDKHYRTKTDAKNTAISGSSMGGLISFYAMLKYPEVFGKAGVFSPAFWINPQIMEYTQKATLNKKSAFYFSCGDSEGGSMTTDMQKIYDIIKVKTSTAAKSPVIVLKGERHNEKQWRDSFPAFYQWLGW